MKIRSRRTKKLRIIGFSLICLVGIALMQFGDAWRIRAQDRRRPPVVMISIDGLKPDYVLEAGRLGWKLPNLTAIAGEGAFAEGVVGVTPTVTYSSHTTLITGAAPARHGIYANTPFDPFSKNLSGWNWYAEDIRVSTLWEAAGRAGLATASIDWPVSVGADIRYNIVQYWRAATEDDHKLNRALSTRGLVAEAERDCGPFPAAYEYDLEGDIRRAKFLVWMLEKKRPDFMTGYFSALDEEQHHTGPYTPETRATLERIDGLVGEVRKAALNLGEGRAVFAIVSDHGHILSENELHLNSALREAGLFEVDGQNKLKSWRAMAWSSSGSAAVMIRDAGDSEASEKVRQMLVKLRGDAANGIDRVLEGEEARRLGGFPDAAFIVGMKPGFRVGGALTGAVLRKGKPGGTHGYLPGDKGMEASFFITGPGIQAGKDLGRIDMRDVAPTIAALLGVELPQAEGRNLLKR